jgi:ribonuclease HI
MSLPFSGVPAPHFHLHSEAAAAAGIDRPAGRWRFVLQSADGRTCAQAEDDEPETSAERLQLLAIVRGLESLDEPARVTLVAPGRSISRGIRYGVAQWREDDWQWERYGKWTPVKNGDLWRRIDRAMAIHEVVCRESPAETDDLADSAVRVIHRTHRGRKLRIDHVRATASPARSLARQPSGRPAGLFDWLAHSLARLLGPILPRSRPPVCEQFT